MATTRNPRAQKARPVMIADTTAPDLLDLYIEELSNEPVATAEAQKALARRMRNTKLPTEEREEARDELIRANLRFAFSVAKQYQNRGLPLEDLVGEANAGLCRAADKYNPDVGVNFISYAVWWIRQAIFSAISTKTHTVRVPLGLASDVRKIARARTALRETLDREPTLEELARVAELPPDIVRELSIAMQPERSLDEPLGAGNGRPEARTLASILAAETEEGTDVDSRLEDESRREALLRPLSPLPPRDRRILMMYYGLETGEPMTMEQIAQVFGVTRERVRQLRDRALAAVREGEAASALRRDWAA
jgi:RNA polymerase primary sigma factor